MKPKTMILLVIAVTCGLGASWLAKDVLLKANTQPATVDDTVAVLVAKQNIPSFQVLKDPMMFEVKHLPKVDVHKGTLSDFAKLEGKALRTALKPGVHVSEYDLLAQEQIGILEKLKQPGMRAMPVKVNPITGAAGFIQVGSHVDVVATQIRSTGRGQEPYAETILQDVEVLAIDSTIQAPETAQAKQADTVTLLLNQEQVEIVAIFADTGSLRLILRNPNDKVITEGVGPRTRRGERAKQQGDPNNTDVSPVAPGQIVGPSMPTDTKPEAEAPKTWTMSIFNGNKMEKTRFIEGEDTEFKPEKKKQ